MKTTVYGSANNLNQYPTIDSGAFSYNGDGCLTSDGVNTYAYDSHSRLVSVSGSGGSVSFKYDPFGRLVEKTAGTSKWRYVYAGVQRIAEYDAGGVLLRRYV